MTVASGTFLSYDVNKRNDATSIGMDEKLLTPAQAAERLQVTERTVYQWLRQGKLPGHRLGRLWRIHPRDYDSFLKRTRQQYQSGTEVRRS